MTNDRAEAEEQEQRRAEESRLIEERNAAARAAEGDGEQSLILPGEPDAAAVTGLEPPADNVAAQDTVHEDAVSDESDDAEAAVDLGGHDD